MHTRTQQEQANHRGQEQQMRQAAADIMERYGAMVRAAGEKPPEGHLRVEFSPDPNYPALIIRDTSGEDHATFTWVGPDADQGAGVGLFFGCTIVAAAITRARLIILSPPNVEGCPAELLDRSYFGGKAFAELAEDADILDELVTSYSSAKDKVRRGLAITHSWNRFHSRFRRVMEA